MFTIGARHARSAGSADVSIIHARVIRTISGIVDPMPMERLLCSLPRLKSLITRCSDTISDSGKENRTTRPRAIAHPRSICVLRNANAGCALVRAREPRTLHSLSLSLLAEIYGATRGALNQKQYFCAPRLGGAKYRFAPGFLPSLSLLRSGKRK